MPEYIAENILDVDFNLLEKRGIKAALIDLDGTVVERGRYDVSAEITITLKAQPLKIYIATNRPKSRDLKDLKERLHANGVLHPRGIIGKPFKAYYKQAVAMVGLKPGEAIMIGDRYIQDIVGANQAGLHTLAVKKLDKPVNTFDVLLSAAERRLTSRLSKRYKPAK